MRDKENGDQRGLIPKSIYSDEEYKVLLSNILKLLSKQTAKYTMGESSSVTVETAEELLKSLWYTISVFMEETGTSYTELLSINLNSVLKEGQEIISEKVKKAKRLWNSICNTAPMAQNRFYYDTLKSIKEFFEHYDIHFFAHSYPQGIDYPLISNPDEGLQGVSYVHEYLINMLEENFILRKFSGETLAVLYRVSIPDYKNFFFNLCEQPLINALGRAAIGEPPLKLYINRGELSRITDAFAVFSPENLIKSAAVRLCKDMNRQNDFTALYIKKLCENLLPRISSAMRGKDLSGIFIPFSEKDN